jgi:manganese transport system ATP-binding protein
LKNQRNYPNTEVITMNKYPQTQPAIEVEDLLVAYDGKIALSRINLELELGTINALVGPNGGGKSTLFKAIMGFITPSRGKVLIEGVPVQQAQKKNRIAYVPQSEEIDWNFPISVQEVVMMGRYGYMNILRRPSAEDRRVVDESLERVQMTAFRDRQIGALSGGQRKRVFLARALAQEGAIMLLDEPFTGVDAKTEQAIIDLLLELSSQGSTILVSTHDLNSIPRFCDHVVMVNRTLVTAGPIESVFTQDNITRTFGGVLMGLTPSSNGRVEHEVLA